MSAFLITITSTILFLRGKSGVIDNERGISGETDAVSSVRRQLHQNFILPVDTAKVSGGESTVGITKVQ